MQHSGCRRMQSPPLSVRRWSASKALVDLGGVSSLTAKEETWSAHRREKTSSVVFGHVWRSHHCSDCIEAIAGSEVSLIGWVHHVRALGAVAFIVLRDDTGLLQIKCSRDALPSTPSLESVIQVRGVVRSRPASQANKAMATGGVEVEATQVTIVNASNTPLPLPVGETVGQPAREEARLRHRYLDLRSLGMQERLRTRSAVLFAARCALFDAAFTEVETPTLFRRTSEGAREFLVPTRQRSRFYALPQVH
jgi:aspartyl-tRNA synthetase